MSRSRDSQRSKVWGALHATFRRQEEFSTLKECGRFLDRCLADKRMKARYPTPSRGISLKDGRGRTHAGFGDDIPYEWCLPKDERTRWRMLMLLTWTLLWPMKDDPWHGWRFCETYLYLVRRFIGRHEHDRLVSEFKSRRIRYREPRKRTLTPEQREAAASRLAHARLVKEARDLEGWNLGRLKKVLDS